MRRARRKSGAPRVGVCRSIRTGTSRTWPRPSRREFRRGPFGTTTSILADGRRHHVTCTAAGPEAAAPRASPQPARRARLLDHHPWNPGGVGPRPRRRLTKTKTTSYPLVSLRAATPDYCASNCASQQTRRCPGRPVVCRRRDHRSHRNDPPLRGRSPLGAIAERRYPGLGQRQVNKQQNYFQFGWKKSPDDDLRWLTSVVQDLPTGGCSSSAEVVETLPVSDAGFERGRAVVAWVQGFRAGSSNRQTSITASPGGARVASPSVANSNRRGKLPSTGIRILGCPRSGLRSVARRAHETGRPAGPH